MTIEQRINQEILNNPNLEEIGIYNIDGCQNGFLFDKENNKIIQISESKDLFSEDDLPELGEFEYDINKNGLKDLLDDILNQSMWAP